MKKNKKTKNVVSNNQGNDFSGTTSGGSNDPLTKVSGDSNQGFGITSASESLYKAKITYLTGTGTARSAVRAAEKIEKNEANFQSYLKDQKNIRKSTRR